MEDSKNKTQLYKRNSPEEHRRILERAVWENDHVKGMRESCIRQFGIDMKDAKAFPVTDPGFKWSKVKRKLIESGKLREADSETSFVQVLRVGVQSLVNSMYMTVPTVYDQWTTSVPSKMVEELYAPLHGLSFPQEVGEQEIYGESYALGLDIKLRNRKYGQIYPVSLELLEGDTTGQFAKLAGLMAEYGKIVIEVLAHGKLSSVANMQYANLKVPQSETKPSNEANYPWASSSAPLVGGGITTGTADVALSQAAIQTAIIALMNQLNLLGLKMLVQPDTILISPHYSFDLSVLLNSAYYPSGAATAGNVGGAFSINPMKGILDPVISRFIFDSTGSVTGDTKAWFVTDKKVPAFVVQLKEPASVEQENPASGRSFDSDVARWKLRIRANADFIDPRFFYRGSSGTV